MGHKHFRSSDIYDVVAFNIKKRRKEVGLTQLQVAELTGYSHEFIRQIESIKRKGGFSIEAVYIISKVLNIPISQLFEVKKESDN